MINIRENNGRCLIRFKCPITKRYISKTYGSYADPVARNDMERVAILISQDISKGVFQGSIDPYMPGTQVVAKTSLLDLLRLKYAQTGDVVLNTLINRLEKRKPIETAAQCKKWLDALGVSPGSYNRYRAAIGAVRGDLVEGIDTQKVTKELPDPFTLDEQELLRNSLRNSEHEQMILFWLKCGFRNGELAALTFEDFCTDRGNYWVSISKSKVGDTVKPQPKNKKPRKIPLSEHDWRKYREPFKGKGMLYGSVRWSTFNASVWRPLLEQSGIRYRKPYTLRKTAISNYLHNGGKIHEASAVFGTGLRMIEQHYLGLVSNAKQV